MVDLSNSKQSEVGEEAPKDTSKKVVDSIVDDVMESVEPAEEAKKEGDPKQEPPAQEAPVEEASPEVQDETVQDVEAPEQQDEDLIPRSKVQERMDQLTAKIKNLESENQRLSTKKPESNEEKLDRLSVEELKSLRRQTKLAQRTEVDQQRLEQLIDLEESVEEKIQDYPQRFRQRQVNNLQSVLPEFAKIDPQVSSMKGDLWGIASSIYQRSQALQSNEMGQVEAMLLAAEHLDLKRSSASNQEKGSTLSRQVQTLKKKTSLEGKTRVQGDRGINLQKLREKAKSGDSIAKEEFFKEAVVPDDFLQL